ncbi:hypothetical protein GOV04_01310 [Candidatus Woesearchaeota archaeon]|nr:hypothetical protein [Candidatus Woesearchaeota archaeon]
MQLKKIAKGIATVVSAVSMLGATVMGAMAADLANYPAPFVADGNFDALLVVGNSAAAEDIVGAIDIATSLQFETKQPIAVGGAAAVSVTGGKTEEVTLGDALNATAAFGNSLDDDDVAALQESRITIDIGDVDNEYDVHDELRFTNGVSVETGLTYSNQDEDFGSGVFMPLTAGGLSYYYVFDDALETGNYLSDASTTDPVEIEFMGRKLKITSATGTGITARVGQEFFMGVGDAVTVNGKEVTLLNVGTGGNIVVDVDGVVETVSNKEDVNGIEIDIDDFFYEDNKEDRSATLIIGTEATKTYQDSDEYIGQDEDDPDWVWVLSGINTSAPILGVEFDQYIDDPDDNPVTVGGCYEFPEGFAKVCLDSLTENDYKKFTIDTTTDELYAADGSTTLQTSAKVLTIEAAGGEDNGFAAGAGAADDTDLVALYEESSGNIGVYWEDSSNGNKLTQGAIVNASSGTLATIDFQDTALAIGLQGWASGSGNLTLGSELSIYIETSSSDFIYLGHSDGDTVTASDVVYTGGAVNKDISGWEEDTLTSAGLVVFDYDGSASNDKFEFEVNGDTADFKANVVVYGAGAAVASSAGGSIDAPVKINVGAAKLDSEISDVTAQNLIVVGGPCINTAAQRLMGSSSPLCGEASGLSANTATVKLFEQSNGNVAMLVAGWTASDTRRATRVVADYDKYSLSGDEVVVTGTSLSDISVSAPSE